MIRPCPNCLRNTEVDRVPAEAIEEAFYDNNVRKTRIVMVIPGYSVCSFCGWCFGYDDEPIQETA